MFLAMAKYLYEAIAEYPILSIPELFMVDSIAIKNADNREVVTT